MATAEAVRVRVRQEFDEVAYDALQAQIKQLEPGSLEYKQLSREALKMLSLDASSD
jgi:hypothetical protein